MLFGACDITFYPVYAYESVISHGSRLCCGIPVAGRRVFQRDGILLQDNANEGMLISSLSKLASRR
jgi:hypothetical protein